MKHLTLESIKPFSVLFVILIFCAVEVWGDNYTDTYTNPTGTNTPARANGMGAFSVIGSLSGNVSFGNSALQIGTNGGSGTFEVASKDGSYITSIDFTSQSSYPINTLTSDQGTITGTVSNVYTFTPNSPTLTSATFSMSAQSGKKTRVAPIVVNLTSDKEYFSKNFTISSGTVSCTKSNASTDITISSTGGTNNNGLTLANTKALTITSAGHNIKKVNFVCESHNIMSNLSANTGTYGSNAWTAGADTKTVTFTSSGSNATIVGISVELEPACSAAQPGTINKGTMSGGVITLTASGTPGTGEVWYWQGTADGTATTESGATKNVTTAGTYYIRSYKASETCWSAATSVTVEEEDFYTPSAPPVITTQPKGASYDAGETVTPLTIVATGSGTLTYQWKKDGVDISGAISDTYTPTSSGTYTCVVTNTEAGHSPVSVVSDEAVIVIQSNTYILQGISGTSGTGTLTGDFYTGATTMATVPATSYDGVSYTNGVQLGGGVTGWSNMSYHDRMVRYDCKTTHTEFTIVVYNKNGSAKKIYVGDIKENLIGTANTVSSLSSYSVSGTSSLTQTYTIDNDKLTPASLYITVESNDVRIVQVIANETGTPLPTPGSVGYTLNFNKPRIGVRSGEKAWLDDPDFEYAPNSNAAAGNSERIQVSAKGTNYIQFRTDQPSAVKIGVQKNPLFYVADDKDGTSNVITIPKKSTDGDAIYTVMVGAGMHYIVPNGSNLYVTSLQILSTTQITLSATGAYNKYTASVEAIKGNAMPEVSILPMRVGYVFGGYYDEPNGAGTQYYNGLGAGVRNWDKDVATATLYAHWVAPCDMAPTLKRTVPTITIRDGQDVDMALVHLSCDFDTTGIQYVLESSSEAIPGCTYKYEDERIYIQGRPTLENASTVTKTITFTVANTCSPARTYNVDATIRIYPASQRSKIAFIITGTEKASIAEGGSFSAYDTDDATACEGLLTYLNGFYDVTCVNGYATKNEAEIAAYYEQYDLLVVTDFLSTDKGYTNQIGTLIDKKPILSFEAYVAGKNGSNWHIGSNPKDPSPKVQDMKILCAGHAIFGDAEGVDVINDADTTVHVLSSLSTETDAKGLQGFVINEAPDYIFLATIKDADNKRDLIVCCERQVVFPARLLLYGINFYEMDNLSPAGRVVMHQMIDYLLMTDETKVADCSLVFDNGAGNHGFVPGAYSGTGTRGDGKWSTAANWFPGYNIVPTPYHPTRIIAECHVDVDNAHAGSVKVNQGRDENGDPVDGKVIVEPYGGLTVAGMVAKVNNTRYASPITIKAEDLVIKSDASGNGSFVYGNKESDVRATVQYYSRAEGAQTAKPVWQYIGIPFQASKTAINMYYEAWMCRWSNASDGGLGGLWQWVDNNDVLVPFEGYCITQESKKTYSFTGKLNAPVTTTIELDNYDPADGFAFAANSWTAPIKIQEMQDGDFVNAEKAIYIYHTGSYDDWTQHGTPVSSKDGAVATLPGQYAVVPIHSSPYIPGADSVIPSMQGFFVKTTGDGASIQLVYNRVVYDATYFKTSTQPMRSPCRAGAEGGEPEVMRMVVSGQTSGGDQIHILTRSDFSDTFEDGWDGRKIAGDTAAPYLAVVKEAGEMAVASIAEYEGRNLSFRAGEDIEYTFTFNYDGDEIYLYDRENGQATLIRTGNTYTFSAVNKTPENRFLITANPPRTPTDLENTEYRIQNTEPKKFIYEDKLLIFYRGVIYDALGAPVKTRKETAQ